MKINIKRFVTNPIGENCYLVWDDSLECAIIDCGALGEAQENKISHFIEENRLHPVLALQTHMHFDHIFGLHFLYRTYGLQPMFHASEQPIYDFAPAISRNFFCIDLESPLVPVKQYLTDGQELQIGNSSLRVLHTPGHTPGGLCFYLLEVKALFSGDTLFQGSVGRTDFLGGSMEALVDSIKTKIFTLPDDVIVYPGHGPSTTVCDERQFNPYM